MLSVRGCLDVHCVVWWLISIHQGPNRSPSIGDTLEGSREDTYRVLILVIVEGFGVVVIQGPRSKIYLGD